jgi:hypothetical protein
MSHVGKVDKLVLPRTSCNNVNTEVAARLFARDTVRHELRCYT